jgi:hypothetical protein
MAARELIVILLLSYAPFAQGVRVPGTSVALEPPAGFTPATRFTGFERADVQGSIMVTEIPGPFASVSAGMNASGLASRGMTLLSSAKRQVDGRPALLLSVTQAANGIEFMKWMLVTGDAKRTVMVVATFPKQAEAELSEQMRAAVLSTHSTVAAPTDAFEGLAFRVTPSATLKIAGRMNNMLMLTESGTMGPHGPDAAVFFVGTSVSTVSIADLKAFAATRAQQTTQLKGIRISRQAETTIGASPAHEIVADGTDAATGRSVTLYQIVVPDEGGYVVMQGLVASSRAATMVPEFRRIANSYRRGAR